MLALESGSSRNDRTHTECTLNGLCRQRIEDTWNEAVQERGKQQRYLAMEGWLWKVALTGMTEAEASSVVSRGGKRFWCSLIGASGLCWSAEKGGPLCGFVPLEAISRCVALSRSFECSTGMCPKRRCNSP